MSVNPLQRHFRRPALWITLPTGGRWYDANSVQSNANAQIQVYGLTAKDDIMLNTPDALLNGHALETVIKSCVPEVRNVRVLLQPDLDAIFLGIKAASNNGKFEVEHKCEQCQHNNVFDVMCNQLIDGMTHVQDSDCVVSIDNTMLIHIKPYSYEMRTLMIQKQLEEQRTLTAIERDGEITDDMQRAEILARSIEKLAETTFRLVAGSVTAIELLGTDAQIVSDSNHIAEWLMNTDKHTADAVINAVNTLNKVGPPKSTSASCTACGHSWEEPLSFDPALFFTRLSPP